jgi:hypothetical protein
VIPAEVMATVKVTTSTTRVRVVKSWVNCVSDQFTSMVVSGYWSGVRPVSAVRARSSSAGPPETVAVT